MYARTALSINCHIGTRRSTLKASRRCFVAGGIRTVNGGYLLTIWPLGPDGGLPAAGRFVRF